MILRKRRGLTSNEASNGGGKFYPIIRSAKNALMDSVNMKSEHYNILEEL